MIPVRQTKNNCMTACLASILEAPLQSFPDYQSLESGSWLNALNTHLSKHHGVVYIETDAHVTQLVRPVGYHLILIGVPDQGDGGHALVGKDGVPVWDPLGRGRVRTWLRGWRQPDAWGLLVPLDDALRRTWMPTWSTCVCPECQLLDDAFCVYCGCSDSRACRGGCAWLAVDRLARVGVCSSCCGNEEQAIHVLATIGAGFSTETMA